MCKPPTTSTNKDAADEFGPNALLIRLGVGAFLVAGLVVPTVILSIRANQPPVVGIFGDQADNVCDRTQLMFDNVDCVHTPGPQAGANVTKGYKGLIDMGDVVPNTNTYFNSKMCPVNVHWHLGTEHYSLGQYDESGTGPRPSITPRLENDGRSVRPGFRCHHYDGRDPKFTTRYAWEFCVNMDVGETYEVHWPHSSAGACGTADQYQTPFYDGVFCNLDYPTFMTLGAQDIANNVGVHAQVFTVVNDERYYYPNLMAGMIIDKVNGYGQDIAYYTGSTTGTLRSNEMCSQYAPITWQVDRTCHLISASSFDNMCRLMRMQRDNMMSDVHAHGSRELVKDELVANNQVDGTAAVVGRNRRLWADGEGELHEELLPHKIDEHDHHDHDHHHHDEDGHHGHHHHQWY